jgi:hypothetical protein
METHAPSGFAGSIRELTIADGKHLTSMKASKSNLIPNYILSNCWLETTDNGIYDFSGKPDFGRVITGDRDFILARIRIETFGPQYTFKVRCKNQPFCKVRFEWEIDLSALPVKKLSKKDRETFRNGNRFEEIIPGTNRKVWFKLATGNDLIAAAQQRKTQKHADRNKRIRAKQEEDEENLILESLAMRIVDIEGVSPNEPLVKKKKLIRAALESLGLKKAPDLLDLFDSHDCGIETTIEVECPECEHQQDVALPFGEDFFFPRKQSPSVGSTVMMLQTKESTKPEEEETEEEDEEDGE